MKRMSWTLGGIVIAISLVALSPAKTIAIHAPIPVDIISGKGWSFSLNFKVKNKAIIQRLIQCESGGQNISRPDSNGLSSDGILQFNRGKDDTVGSGTWAAFSKRSGIIGSPLIPSQSIAMTDWAISNDLLGHWTCAHLLGMTGDTKVLK